MDVGRRNSLIDHQVGLLIIELIDNYFNMKKRTQQKPFLF